MVEYMNWSDNMLKRILLSLLCLLVSLCILGAASYIVSYNKSSKIELSVVNKEIIKESQLTSLFESDTDSTLYLMIYDYDNDDCIYLDEVLLRNKSMENSEVLFDEIYKINYKNTVKAYNAQKIKNLYQVETIPSIVKVKKVDEKYEILDKFEWSSVEKENLENLDRFLKDNQFIK